MSDTKHSRKAGGKAGAHATTPSHGDAEFRVEHSQEILDSLPQIVFECDMNGNIVYANHAAFAMTGYEPEDVRTGIPMLQMISPDDRERAKANIELGLAGTPAVGNKYLFVCKDGRTFPCMVFSRPTLRNGKVAGLCGFVVDITERREAERRLRESEEKYRVLVEHLHEGIWVLDAEGRTTFVSHCMAEMLGSSVEEMRGKRLTEFVDEAGVEECRRGLERRREGVNESQHIEFVRKDGSRLYVRLGVAPLYDAQRRYAGSVMAITDLTEQRGMETKLRDANRRLEATLSELRHAQEQIVREERLHALGQMAGGIAHEFNNALTPIVGFTELLLEKPELSNRREKLALYLEMIHAAARDAAKVVRGLSDFCRQKEFADVFGTVDLNELAEEVSLLTQPKWKTEAAAAGRCIELVLERGAVPVVHGDKAGLREALINLIFNAVEAMPKGGRITVETRGEGEEVVLSVRDDGEGMSADVRQRCLEPFFTTRGAQATGLGLPAALGIVRRHGGTLDVQSEVGAGTTVAVRLPAAVAARDVVRDVLLEMPRAVPAAARVLVVDDEPLNLRFIEATLRAHGYDVDTADSGEEAVRKIGGTRYALVITDWAMKGLHGGDVAAHTRQFAPGTPLILLTGFDETPRAGWPPEGVSLVLHKPASIGTLTEAVSRLTGPHP